MIWHRAEGRRAARERMRHKSSTLVARYNPENRHERTDHGETGCFRRFTYDELVGRDTALVEHLLAA